MPASSDVPASPDMPAGKAGGVDDYLETLPPQARGVLTEIRLRIHRMVPGAVEKISYGIPTITVGGRSLVYFAAWTNHISVYPVPTTDEALTRELAGYLAAKGTLRFRLDRPIPYDLIERVAVALAAERRGPGRA